MELKKILMLSALTLSTQTCFAVGPIDHQADKDPRVHMTLMRQEDIIFRGKMTLNETPNEPTTYTIKLSEECLNVPPYGLWLTLEHHNGSLIARSPVANTLNSSISCVGVQITQDSNGVIALRVEPQALKCEG